MDLHVLDLATASRFAETALGHVTREYPHKADHVMDSEADVYTPRNVHPIFFGSFDWHSCVHGHWVLARVLRMHPAVPQAGAVQSLFRSQFQAGKVQVERDYLARSSSRNFEQPYGWAWFLMLIAEVRRIPGLEARSWTETLEPLTVIMVERLKAYLLRLTYPVRCGTHTNTAFALVLAAEYAQVVADDDLQQLLRDRTLHWFGGDKDAPGWEPSGEDFLSPTLLEAEAMRRLAPPELFGPWFQAFLPRIACCEPASLFSPAYVSDRNDGKIGHLDGLNLSRGWCLRLLASDTSLGTSGRAALLNAAQTHIEAVGAQRPRTYMSEHWLASFALLAATV